MKQPGSHRDSSWLKSLLLFYLRNRIVQSLFHYHWQITKGMPIVMYIHCPNMCIYIHTQYMQCRCMYSSGIPKHGCETPLKPSPSPESLEQNQAYNSSERIYRGDFWPTGTGVCFKVSHFSEKRWPKYLL